VSLRVFREVDDVVNAHALLHVEAQLHEVGDESTKALQERIVRGAVHRHMKLDVACGIAVVVASTVDHLEVGELDAPEVGHARATGCETCGGGFENLA